MIKLIKEEKEKMKRVFFVLLNVLIFSLYSESKMNNILVVSNGIEYDIEGNEILKFETEYNDIGLLKTVNQIYLKPEIKQYRSEYSYDDQNRMIKTDHYLNDQLYAENLMNYDIENRVILISKSDANILTETYIYDQNKLTHLILQYNNDAARVLKLDTKYFKNEMIIRYYENEAKVETFIAKYLDTKIIKILHNGKKINFNYIGNELSERITDNSVFKIESELIQSVKSHDYSFFKDFFNIWKLDKRNW